VGREGREREGPASPVASGLCESGKGGERERERERGIGRERERQRGRDREKENRRRVGESLIGSSYRVDPPVASTAV
jgi:hypothetical protein